MTNANQILEAIKQKEEKEHDGLVSWARSYIEACADGMLEALETSSPIKIPNDGKSHLQFYNAIQTDEILQLLEENGFEIGKGEKGFYLKISL